MDLEICHSWGDVGRLGQSLEHNCKILTANRHNIGNGTDRGTAENPDAIAGLGVLQMTLARCDVTGTAPLREG